MIDPSHTLQTSDPKINTVALHMGVHE